MNAPASVLIVLMGALGDLVRGLSVATALRDQSPDIRIGWLVDSKWKAVVDLHGGIDVIHTFHRSRGVAGLGELRSELKREAYDLVFDMQRHFKSGLCSRLSGASRRIGFHRKNAKEGNHLFNTEFIPPRDPMHPKIDQYFDFLIQAGFEKPEPVRFGFEGLHVNELIASERLPEHAYIACVLGSSWESKDWPLEGYQGLIRTILDESPYGVVLVGAKDQLQRAETLMTSDSRIASLVGESSLVELFGILKQAVVAVGPDSGPGHIAAAVATPYVSLFGPTPVARVAPYGMQDYAVTASVACRPCYRRSCPGLNTLCMRLISPEAVWKQLQQLPGFNPFPIIMEES